VDEEYEISKSFNAYSEDHAYQGQLQKSKFGLGNLQ
jgi:hypothetical protein